MKISKAYFFILLMIIYFSLSCDQSLNKELPVYNPSDFNPELVDISLQNKKEDHTVLDFELINQNGELITQDHYKDKIYIVDFFFTSCPSICPIMTTNMAKLQNKFYNENDVMFLSISVTPNMDSIPVLKKYAIEQGVIDSKWNITTGNKKHIYELARKSYFAAVDQGDGGVQDFIHTPYFILVDKKKRIRGVYDGTKDIEVERLERDIKILTN
ncbi:SCO family protein [Gramella jeungdoensis]|uniref:SCO family protein n=1 Tax=Gramella jeungdoensis TaxID=708091 RepID=A0ABT0YYM6_9FLAO|nr:SCO family protein [Gramella jeungdoensis]MCM8568568.1 SCO family protein [Gramella jeungdoensis]